MMRRCRLTMFWLPLLLAGCTSSEFDLAPVSGTVTLDGEPVAGARVIFEPQRTGEAALSAGPSSDGQTDDDGRYVLQTSVKELRGAVVGPHTVTISTYMAESDRSRDTSTVIRKEEIPERYHEPGALTFDVPSAGSDSANFDLNTRDR